MPNNSFPGEPHPCCLVVMDRGSDYWELPYSWVDAFNKWWDTEATQEEKFFFQIPEGNA